jgi:hypothetical protein
MNGSSTEEEAEYDYEQNPEADCMKQVLEAYSGLYDLWRARKYRYTITSMLKSSSMIKKVWTPVEEEIVQKIYDEEANRFNKVELINLLSGFCDIQDFVV